MQAPLQSVGSVTTAHGVKAVVYGQPGAGKTRLILSCPNPVIISAEKGLLSLRQEGANLPVWEIRTMAELKAAHAWALGSHEAKQFDTFCLDSISEIAEVTLVASQKANAKDGWKPYQDLQKDVMQIFRDFRDFAHKHVYFACKEEYDKDGVTQMSKYMPSMPGKVLTQQIPYIFDEIFRLVVFTDPATGQQYSALRTQPDQSNIAKDRSGRLALWEPPHLGNIFAKILG